MKWLAILISCRLWPWPSLHDGKLCLVDQYGVKQQPPTRLLLINRCLFLDRIGLGKKGGGALWGGGHGALASLASDGGGLFILYRCDNWFKWSNESRESPAVWFFFAAILRHLVPWNYVEVWAGAVAFLPTLWDQYMKMSNCLWIFMWFTGHGDGRSRGCCSCSSQRINNICMRIL